MKSLGKRLLAGTTILVVLIVLVGWLLLRGSLPELDGVIEVEGLSADASISRDADGIPVITAVDRMDLAYATGFAHAQDRFFQMDLIRRQAAGELAELFGAPAIDVDKRYRFHRFRARAQKIINAVPAEDRQLLENYAKGVNAGLASLSVRPFEYLLIRTKPQEWRAEDSILVVFAMYVQLNDSRARKDVRQGLAHSVFSTDVYDWLYPEGTDWDAPLMGEPRLIAGIPGPDSFDVRPREENADFANETDVPPLPGSNNWAVGGALTSHGRALVSNDMHLGLSVPNIYYQARLVTTGDEPRDVTGVTLPGAPVVAAGSNGSVAWGYTNSQGDWSDAVIVSPGSRDNTYLTADGDEAFSEFVETIRVKGGDDVEYRIRETRWGPVDDEVEFSGNEIAVSWIAHKTDATNLEIIKLETAKNLQEAMSIANRMGMPPQNFVAGDAGGNIGWTLTGKIPVRTSFNASVPADWSKADGWTGWYEPTQYPSIVNPGDHRIWTANARVADGEALDKIGFGNYDLGARARQIRERLREKDSFEPEDMLAIQRDAEAVHLARWRDLVLAQLDDDVVESEPQLGEYRRLVNDWVPAAVPESVGYRLVRAFRLEVRARVFNSLMAPVREIHGESIEPLISNQFEAPLWSLLNEQPAHLLPEDYTSWQHLMLEAIRQNIYYFDENFPGGLHERTWGERNTARIAHPVSQAIPDLSGWLDMPREPLAGDVNLPLAQGPTFGASERFSVSPGDEENGLMQMPTGQSGHPMSEFYRRGHDDWVNGTPSPFLPGDTVHELVLTTPR